MPRDATPGSEVIAIREPTVRIGRDADNGVVLAEPSVSAAHAELRLRGGVWLLEDLGSVNGSWVDGEPVHGVLPLARGSSVRFGTVDLVFAPHDRWEDSPVIVVSEPVVVRPEAEGTAPNFMISATPSSAWPVAWLLGGGLILLAIVAIVLAGGSR